MDTNQSFGVLKTSKSKESSISKISTLGLLACSVTLLGFRTDFAIHEFAISTVHQSMYFVSHGSKSFRPLELEGVTSVADCVKCVPIPAV